MKKITQLEMAETLGCGQATISRYLTNSRNITLKDAVIVSTAHNLPITIFIDANLQIKYFGKSFITDNSISNEHQKQCQKNIQKVGA